jgi:hypothetical protein
MNMWLTSIKIKVHTKVVREPPDVFSSSGRGVCLLVNEVKDVLGCVGDCEDFSRRLDVWDNGGWSPKKLAESVIEIRRGGAEERVLVSSVVLSRPPPVEGGTGRPPTIEISLVSG